MPTANTPPGEQKPRNVYYFTARGDDYPLGIFSSRKKMFAEIDRLTKNNRQAKPADFQIHKAELR